MSQDYPWQCLICSASDDAASLACSQCGFPARATGREIAKAQAERDAATVLAERGPPRWPAADVRSRPGTFETVRDTLSPLSAWRRGLACVGGVLFAAGGLALKVAWSLAGLGWGAVGLAGGAAVVALAFAGVRSGDGG